MFVQEQRDGCTAMPSQGGTLNAPDVLLAMTAPVFPAMCCLACCYMNALMYASLKEVNTSEKTRIVNGTLIGCLGLLHLLPHAMLLAAGAVIL